jgi:hypothetical protein
MDAGTVVGLFAARGAGMEQGRVNLLVEFSEPREQI